MAMTEKRARDMKRDAIAQTVYELIEQLGEEVMWTKSNELCFPCVDELGNEQFARITISIPTGSKGDPYDGYALAEDYKMKQAMKAEKAAAKEAEKQAKIERDKARREKVKEIHNKKTLSHYIIPFFKKKIKFLFSKKITTKKRHTIRCAFLIYLCAN